MSLGQAFHSVRGDAHPLAEFRAAAIDLVAPEDPSDAVAQHSAADRAKQDDHDKSVQVLSGAVGGDAGNILGGRNGRTGVAAAIQEHLKSEDRMKKRQEDAQLLALLADLRAQIKVLDREIAQYDEQLSATDELLALFGLNGENNIDPTDPEHQALLRKAGIPVDEWGTVTREDIIERQEEIEAAKREAEAKRDGLEQDVESLERSHSVLQEHVASGTDTPEMHEQFINDVEEKGIKVAYMLGVDTKTEEIINAKSEAYQLDEDNLEQKVVSELGAFGLSF